MKKITLWLLTLFAVWQLSAQSTCTQTFTVSGYDDSGANLTINSTDLNCNGTGTITSIQTVNASGSLASSYCTTDQTSWYSFLVSIDGGAGTYMCGSDFNNIDLTGFSSLSITAQDDDSYSDYVTLTLDIEVTFTPVSVPSCVALSSPVDGATSVSSTVISWPSASNGVTGYKLTVGTVSGGTNVLNMSDVGDVLSYDLGALSVLTTYYVTITPYNSVGDATGCTESSFTTCGINTIPYFEGFETGYVDAQKVENCIEQESVGGTNSWTANNSATDYNRTPRSGAWNAYLRFGNEDWLFIPIELNGSTLYSVELYARQDDVTATDSNIQISYGTTPNAAGMTETIVPATGIVDGDYQRIAGTFMPATTGTYYVGIKGYMNSSPWYISLDDITIDLAPPCVEPNNLVASNITSSSVQLDWNDPSGSQFDFQYVIQATGSPAPDASTVGIDVSDYTVTDNSLLPATTYDAYVRAFCSGSEQSLWVGPITFITDCLPVSDFSENFDGVSTPDLPVCWSKILNGAGLSTYASVGTVSTNFSAPNGVSLYNSSSDSASNIMLVSPVLSNLGAGTHRLKFAGRNSTATQDIEIGTLTDPTDPTTFTVFETVDLTTSFAEYTVDFSAYSGVDTYIGFRRLSTSTYTYVYLDDIVWEAIPTVVPSCAANVVATTDTCGNFATAISWDAASGAEGYKIVIGTTSGGNNIVDNQDLGNVLNYSYSGDLNTTYYFTVIPYNVVGDATGCSEQTFTTSSNGCYCMPSSTSSSTYIDNFTATGNAGTDISNLGSGYSTGGYADNSASMNVVAYSGLTFDFNTEIVGGTVGCSVWIDWDGNYSFDSTERVYNTTSYGNGPFTGTITVPSSVADGDYRMRVLIHFNASNPSDPCASNSRLEAEDYTLTVQTPSCSPATIASTAIAEDCSNGQYNIDFDVTDLGDGMPSITDGTNSWSIVSTGTTTVGPFASGSTVSLTLLHGTNSVCDLSLGDFSYTCPPANDECVNAIGLTVGGVFADNAVVGTNVGATMDSSDPTPTCDAYNFATNGKDVWYTVEVPASGNITLETNNNSDAGMTDTGMSVYSGTCGALTLIECNQDSSSDGNFSLISLTGQTPGEILIVRVWGYNANTGSFQVSAYDASLSSNTFDSNSFVAYPNPVKDILTLEYSSDITEVRVMNLLGQEVLVQKANATSAQVNMSDLATGTYILNVQVGNAIKTLKVVKQ